MTTVRKSSAKLAYCEHSFSGPCISCTPIREQEMEDLKIEWLEACTYHGFGGSFAEFVEGVTETADA